MRLAIVPQRFSAFDKLSSADVQALLAGARSRVMGAGLALKHRHVAVLCEQTLSAPADALAAAASALGATVVRLRPSSLKLHDRAGLGEAAALLGRLYCLICTEGLRPSANAALVDIAGVPVLSDVTSAWHPASVLADLLVMQEHAGRPAAAIRLGVAAGTEPATLQAWQLAAGLTGLQLIGITQPPLALAPPACDFYVGCGPPCGEPRQQHLVAAGATASRCTCLAVQQVDAHQRLLQSLMTHVVG